LTQVNVDGVSPATMLLFAEGSDIMQGEFYAVVGIIAFAFAMFAGALAWGDYQTRR